MRQELHGQYFNPYPAETAIFQLEGSSAAAEVTRSMFETARAYTEAFTVLGEHASFEWPQIEEELPVVFRIAPLTPGRGRPVTHEGVAVPDFARRLPEPIRRFTRRGIYDASRPHTSFQFGG